MSTFQNQLRHAIVVMAAGAAGAAFGADITLRERVAPSTSVVRLGDVAEVSSADRQQARQLAALPLMPAPAPGTERFLRKREIADMLAANGVELADIHFNGSEQVAIEAVDARRAAASHDNTASSAGASGNRHAAVLAGLKVESPVTKALDETQAAELRERFGRILSDYINSKTGKTDSHQMDFTVPDRQLAQFAAATAVPVCEGGCEPWSGKQKFLVSFPTADGAVHVPILADVAAPLMQVVVATRPIARGNPITAADVEMRSIENNSKMLAQRPAVESIEKIVGMEAKQAITAGDIVFTDAVQSPVLVKRGDLVSVVSQSSGLRVRTSAKALQEGSQGVLVQVESLDSKQRYDARVTGMREVAVFAQGSPADSLSQQPVATARR